MILLLMLLWAVPSRADSLAENQARFGVITGDVGLLALGAAEWIEPHEGLPMEPGDHIRTGEDGRVELVMGDNAFWTLEPQTDLVAEHMDTNSGRFNLSSGTLLGKVDSARAAGIPQEWEFDTPASVVAIRGTEFALDFSKAGGSHLGVFEGIVEVAPAETAAGRQEPLRIPAGHEAVLQRGKPFQDLSKWSPRMQALNARHPLLARRQRQIQNTWSPFTPAVRLEARRKFVVPAPKPRPIRHLPRPIPARRAKKR